MTKEHYVYNDDLMELTEGLHKALASSAGIGLSCWESSAAREKAFKENDKRVADPVCSIAEYCGLDGELFDGGGGGGVVTYGDREPYWVRKKRDKWSAALKKVTAKTIELEKLVRQVEVY